MASVGRGLALPRSFAAFFIFAIVAVIATGDGDAAASADSPISMTFVNELPDADVEVFWESSDGDVRKSEGTIPPRGGHIVVNTFVGHEFSYDVDGKRHYIQVPPETRRDDFRGQRHVALSGDRDAIPVRCDLRPRAPGEEGDDPDDDGAEGEGEGEGERRSLGEDPVLDIIVKPYWAPRGASRFLELVREGYYDGAAFNRVVPEFLMQFGIAKDVDQRLEWDERPILDDEPVDVPFQPGYVSYAGNGPDSRTTEIFIVMPGTDQEQLDYFGENSWETPFGLVEGVEDTVVPRIYDGYGDMPPWGQGPDPERIYDEDGYAYLREEFPKLDYIDRCYVVDERPVEDMSVEL